MRMNKGQPFSDVEAEFAPDGREGGRDAPPVFSEAFLYPTVGKGDARFILGVADEYEHVIKALGPVATKMLLDVKPRLAQRLGLPAAVIGCLEDAVSDEFLRREENMPSQVILDSDAAHGVWKLLHDEYRRTFDPEKDLDKDVLRAYNVLTDALGRWEQEQRQEERDRLPEKLEKQAERKAQIAARRKVRNDRVELVKLALIEELKMDERKATSCAYYAVRVLGETQMKEGVR